MITATCKSCGRPTPPGVHIWIVSFDELICPACELMIERAEWMAGAWLSAIRYRVIV
jgi:hypothetical protein